MFEVRPQCKIRIRQWMLHSIVDTIDTNFCSLKGEVHHLDEIVVEDFLQIREFGFKPNINYIVSQKSILLQCETWHVQSQRDSGHDLGRPSRVSVAHPTSHHSSRPAPRPSSTVPRIFSRSTAKCSTLKHDISWFRTRQLLPIKRGSLFWCSLMQVFIRCSGCAMLMNRPGFSSKIPVPGRTKSCRSCRS